MVTTWDFPKQTFFFDGLENRHTVRRADVEALRLRLSAQQSNGLPKASLGAFVRLDYRQKAEMRREHGKGGREAAKFFSVIEGCEFAVMVATGALQVSLCDSSSAARAPLV